MLLSSSLSTGAFFSKITAMEKPGKVVESSLRKPVQDTGNMYGRQRCLGNGFSALVIKET